MSQVHSSQMAQRFLSVIRSTQAKEGLEFCFAVGTIVIAGDKKPVVLVRKKGLTSLRRALEDMHYKTVKGVQEPDDFKFLRSGTGRMNKEGIIVVRLAKGGMAKFMAVKTNMRRYFKDLRVSLPDLQEAELLNEEDLNRFEIAAQANADELPSDNQEVAEANPEEGAEEALPEGLKEVVAISAEAIASHSIRISRQTGSLQTAELGPLTNKIDDWLKAMLAATPLEEQEDALHNFTCRLLLMLAYDDHRRNLQYVDEAPDGDAVKTDGSGDGVEREAFMIGGVDLDHVGRHPVEKGEVVETLFRMTKAAAQARRLPYHLENSNSDRITMMVSSQWPSQSAGRREVFERLMAVVEQRLGNDDQLIALLGLSKSDKLEDFDAIVRTIENKWRADLDAALVHWEETKSKIETYNEQARGGTWEPVVELFQEIKDVVSDEFADLVEQGGGVNFDVIERAEAVFEALLQHLDENDVVQMLDNPPTVFGPNSIGKTLREGLSTVGGELNRVRTFLVAANA
ncbi:hypothetical protein HJB56_31420 [Rhizobium lentis]|uniref:Uncharacterized protein n=1 Tax=Rhizobium binae TaxID=1138190 RepID=A0ABV2MR65_9HYPH|nr:MULTISPECIES: hypothetical protein [Rhizobium]NKL51978.1 hypothetical protein [Rhizobium leguminosarum bv. viciae]MBX4996156.1 hypothetical protein [Rhizobium binae]MBX5020603.1 hypothetical protein [Rhizobium lentis]MBX5087225.1 hypothetical protein [Rhizobium lentis]MBX5099981.1 hypothetical protein [Rhizobium lentis]